MTRNKKVKHIKTITNILNEVNEEQKQRFLQCERCKEYKEDVKECIDPYNEEINEEIFYITICTDCYNELVLEI